MINHESVENEILNALRKAAQEGQPVAELMDAIAHGKEVDAWFEPSANGRCALVIATKDPRK